MKRMKHIVVTLVIVLAGLLTALTAQAADVITRLDGDAPGVVRHGEWINDHGTAFARVEGPARTTVLTIEGVQVERQVFAVRGQVRFRSVVGPAYLEMWSTFADGGRFFSRTQAEVGPMGALEGSSDWRAFAMPFRLSDEAPALDKLEVNVVLPGTGEVEVRPEELVELDPEESLLAGQWFSGSAAGLLGGIGGSLLGIVGALVGWFASRGRARRLVLGLLSLLMLVGAASLVAAFLAVMQGQPYAVFYPLLLLGGLDLVLPAGLYRVVLQRYRELELRRMQSMDVG